MVGVLWAPQGTLRLVTRSLVLGRVAAFAAHAPDNRPYVRREELLAMAHPPSGEAISIAKLVHTTTKRAFLLHVTQVFISPYLFLTDRDSPAA